MKLKTMSYHTRECPAIAEKGAVEWSNVLMYLTGSEQTVLQAASRKYVYKKAKRGLYVGTNLNSIQTVQVEDECGLLTQTIVIP